MTKKLKYLRLSAFYFLTDGLSFDVASCADVLDVALVGLNDKTGIPDKIVRWKGAAGTPRAHSTWASMVGLPSR
jgi:hypothetical protein